MGRLCEVMLGEAVFGGATYETQRDRARLRGQLRSVRAAMADGQWHTLAELAAKCSASEAGVSARLRDLRKPEFGGHTVQRQHMSGGLWRYRLLDND